MEDWIYWMIFAVLMAGIELTVFSIFVFGPLALAATATAVVAGLGGSLELQLAVFIVLTLTAMAALYPLAKRHRDGDPATATNVDALVGGEARTLEEIGHESLGLIRFDNSNWTARTAEGLAPIPPDTAVRVVSIAGATAVVEPMPSASTTNA